MKKAIKTTYRSEVLAVALPERTDTYTPIPCKLIFNTVDSLIETNKVKLVKEEFYLTRRGNQQRLHFLFEQEHDDEFTSEIIILNSYDKTMSLRAAGGSSVMVCTNGVIVGDVKIYKKHTSNVDLQLETFLQECFSEMQLNAAKANYTKKVYENIIIDELTIAKALGEMFYIYGSLNSGQLNFIKSEFKNPSFDYNVPPNSLWAFYQHVTLSLQEGNPLKYLENRKKIQVYFATNLYDDESYYDDESERLYQEEI